MSEYQLLAVVGARIKKLRLSRNMTQNELAIECDFEKASMSRIESGQTNVTIRTLHKISKALDVHIVEFFKE
jgi:transcriptional regulator with XRE-family HTH domain